MLVVDKKSAIILSQVTFIYNALLTDGFTGIIKITVTDSLGFTTAVTFD